MSYYCLSFSTLVGYWTAGQQVKRSILRLGHDLYQNSSHQPRLSLAQCSLVVHNNWLKHHSVDIGNYKQHFTVCSVRKMEKSAPTNVPSECNERKNGKKKMAHMIEKTSPEERDNFYHQEFCCCVKIGLLGSTAQTFFLMGLYEGIR